MPQPRPSWDTPPNGDFAAYVDRLMAEAAARSAAPAVPVSPAARAPARAQPAPRSAPDRRAARAPASPSAPSAPAAQRPLPADGLREGLGAVPGLVRMLRSLRQGVLLLAVLLWALWWWGGGVPVGALLAAALWWALGRLLQWLGSGGAPAAPRQRTPTS